MKTVVTIHAKDLNSKVVISASVERKDLTRGEMHRTKAALANHLVEVIKAIPYSNFSVLDISIEGR